MENKREKVISIENLSVDFKIGKGIFRAVNNVSFDVFEGETFGLVGESGSGKSTIIKTIIQINEIAEGSIKYKDFNITNDLSTKEKRKLYKDIQMIYQDPAACLNERANVDYIVSEGLRSYKMFNSEEERQEKVAAALKQVGLLPEHTTRYPHEFSGGQRQRIGIARSLIVEPKVILADEPISALDVSIRAQVLNLMRKIQKENDLTCIFIAHDLSIVRYISDRIGVMHRGNLVEVGPALEVSENPLHPYTKSLLSAIPQPSPDHEKARQPIPYDMTGINYEECQMVEVRPGHFVLANDELLAKWKLK